MHKISEEFDTKIGTERLRGILGLKDCGLQNKVYFLPKQEGTDANENNYQNRSRERFDKLSNRSNVDSRTNICQNK